MIKPDEVYIVGRGSGADLQELRHNSGDAYLRGAITTQNGYVTVYSTGTAKDGFTQISYIYEGKLYRGRADRGYTKRGLVIIAARFAADVIQGVREEGGQDNG